MILQPLFQVMSLNLEDKVPEKGGGNVTLQLVVVERGEDSRCNGPSQGS